MIVLPIPVARLETIAAAAGSSLLTMRRRISAGQFPPANVRLPGRGQERGWSLPTRGRPNSRVTNRHLEGHSAEFGEKQYVKDLESF